MSLLLHADSEVAPRRLLQRKADCHCGGQCTDCKSGGGEEEQLAASIARSPAGARSTPALLWLQRTAGNGAVAEALMRESDDEEQPASAETETTGFTTGDAGSGTAAGETAEGEAETGVGQELLPGLPDLPDLPKLPSLPKLPEVGPCKPAPAKIVAEQLHSFLISKWIPLSAVALGAETAAVWAAYLDKSDPSIPRATKTFSGTSAVGDGFTKHHKTAEAEKAIVETAAKELAGPQFALRPPPGASATVPVTSVIPASTLKGRLENKSDPMGLDYDQPATTIPGNLAGGIGAGGAPGGKGTDPDTRNVGGDLELTRDVAGTGLSIKPKLSFLVHDTVDFCPGNLGGLVAEAFTVPMSILEATEARFGPVFAADVPIDISHPGPGVAAGPFALPATPPTPPTPPTPGPKFPRSGPATTTGSLLRVRTGPGLGFPAVRLLGEKGTPIEVTTQVHGDPVDGNDVWDKVEGGFVSDRFVQLEPDVDTE